MKHIDNYESFNEGILKPKITKMYDAGVEKIFQRIKDIFDYEKLQKNYHRFTYELEETDSESGYITIEVYKNRIDKSYDINFFARLDLPYTYYYIWIDGQVVNCSRSLVKKIYTFFDEKIENREKEELKLAKKQEEEKALKFKNKYNI